MPHAADDEGLWVFKLCGIVPNVQLESHTWDCPFIVEDDSKQVATAKTVTEAARYVIDYLRAQLT
jgi:hypothetical protein